MSPGQLLINERNPPKGSFRGKEKFPRGTLLTPHKQRETWSKQREEVMAGGPACPADRAEPRESEAPERAGEKASSGR